MKLIVRAFLLQINFLWRSCLMNSCLSCPIAFRFSLFWDRFLFVMTRFKMGILTYTIYVSVSAFITSNNMDHLFVDEPLLNSRVIKIRFSIKLRLAPLDFDLCCLYENLLNVQEVFFANWVLRGVYVQAILTSHYPIFKNHVQLLEVIIYVLQFK